MFRNYTTILTIYILVVAVITIQSLLLENKTFAPGGIAYPQYNNYLIFKQSFFHLINNQDLYASYPAEQGDLFKYSPAFALFFAPFAWLPDSFGLFLWNALNALCLFAAFAMFPKTDLRSRILMMLFVLVELVTALQNSQSNALIAGMMILAFVMLERDKLFLAALLITGTVYIKLFGVFGFGLFLFYPNKMKFILYSALCMILLAVVPLVVISFDQLKFLYSSWLSLLGYDHDTSNGLSVLGWITTWFGVAMDKKVLLLTGVVLLGLPFIQIKKFGYFQFRTAMLASILLWIVIFNHRAESPTFIIAMAGVAVWYFTKQASRVDFILIMLALVFTSLSTTDLFPNSIQDNIFDPYVVKAVPCIIIWGKIIFDSFKQKTLSAAH